jgi:hypothetical protein
MAGNPRSSAGSQRSNGNGWEGTNPFPSVSNSRLSYRTEPSSSEPSITKIAHSEKKKADSLASLYKYLTGEGNDKKL